MSAKLISKGKLRTFLFYLLMMVFGIGAFLLIDLKGQELMDPAAIMAMERHAVHEQINHLLYVLIALSVVVGTARAFGSLFSLIHQPAVIGEVIGGILLGPSFLGKFAPQVSAVILPATAFPFLGVIAQLGVILYMFVVGLELDLSVLRKSGHATLAISHASIVAPFLCGALLALQIYNRVSLPEVPFTSFALFLGVSLSVTAFPVLARILTDRNVNRSKMGTIALTCAAVDDVTAWCLLALVVSLSQAKLGSAFMTLGLTVIYIAAMLSIGGYLMKRFVPWLEKFDRLTDGGMAIFFVGLLLSSLATEVIGIHAIFGAFLLGAITPHDSRVAKELTDRIQDLVRIMFLPAFFAFTGMRTEIGSLNTLEDWKLCGMIILIASVGKFGGTLIAARLTGLDWRNAAALGILMNTRGLVELIVLNLGLDLKIISPQLFTMLVLMALVTTFITSPIFHWLTKARPWAQEELVRA